MTEPEPQALGIQERMPKALACVELLRQTTRRCTDNSILVLQGLGVGGQKCRVRAKGLRVTRVSPCHGVEAGEVP